MFRKVFRVKVVYLDFFFGKLHFVTFFITLDVGSLRIHLNFNFYGLKMKFSDESSLWPFK